MRRIAVRHRSPTSDSYRAARVKSLFNATDEQATRFDLDADLDIEDDAWRLGVIVGPSGSGKSSIGARIWDDTPLYVGEGWPDDAPIVDAIAPGDDVDAVTAALSQAGLGDVPAWLRPYRVLSTGQRFRADLARILAERPARVVVDEFTSVVDRQIARVGAAAFAKSWRRGTGQAVLLTCHYDVLDWLAPDWVYDTATGTFTRGSVQLRRPRISVEVRLGGWGLWPLFQPHHYLDVGPMIAAKVYAAFIDGEPVAHLGVSTRGLYFRTRAGSRTAVEARAARLVVMPEWQGIGLGTRFLNHVAALQYAGKGVLPGRAMTTLFHTSHPHLCVALRQDPLWRQISAALHGVNKQRSRDSIARTRGRVADAGYGGHFRAIQGFRYYGPPA
ncbi:ABC transporter ATP-binding protein [Amycolatopsis sp. PS_44_ISF1]|uniref:ABC transporter ATP-binding protein n=1 Tax=Amycolatopsis sp. PS_44_ISF1 TaxID=2974917 RepID=UPI0028DE5CD8|nr:ABC transporter ATP-binding protein [Amycolatopsis sp. PS_44_ISF1]MDT8910902.1 ABC transporter ATP-binding protein [Amycolatopsis sp. PS_44_ISF1]